MSSTSVRLPSSQASGLAALVEALDAGRVLRADDDVLELSPIERRAMRDIADALRDGARLEVHDEDELISTQVAADLLGVSRPTVVKMLDDGHLEGDRPSVHRRVRRASVMAFRDSRRARRAEGLVRLADDDPASTVPERFVPTR